MTFVKQISGGGIAVLFAVLSLASGGCSGPSDTGKGTPSKTEPTKAASKETPTILTCPHLEDEGCVASIKKELLKVEGVADVQGDLKTKTVKVTPKPGATLSPKALWEAAEKSGEDATKLDGPSGLFTSKPKE